jgi:O-antigen/teichoic acid export membrane protein
MMSGRATSSVRKMLGSHTAILSNASALGGTTLVTSLLGFGFWWVAARLYPPSVVGYGSAAVSAATLLGTVAMIDLGTVLMGELARQRPGSGGLVSASLLASAAAGSVLAIGFVTVGPYVKPIPFARSGYAAALFVIAVALTSLAAVLDEALLGVLLGSVDLRRNFVFSLVKLAALAVLAFVLHDQFGVGILTAWVIGIAVSLFVGAALVRARGFAVLHPPQWSGLKRLWRSAGSHSWLNLVLETPRSAIPLVATGLVSATAGGSFYAVWMVMSMAFMAPNHLCTVLYPVATADPDRLRHELRFTLRFSLIGGAIGVPLLIVLAPIGLHLYGATYADLGTEPLRLLALAYFPVVFRAHYVALSRIRQRTTPAAVLMTVGAALQLGGAVTGAVTGGLVGMTIGLVGGMGVEGVFTAGVVLRTAFARNQEPGSHHLGEQNQDPGAEISHSSQHPGRHHEMRQEP